MLYIIRNSQLSEWQKQTLKSLSAEDAIMFAENGVYNLYTGVINSNANIYALKQDCLSRGVDSVDVDMVDYAAWVKLTTTHKHWLNW
ncbi:sulfurtransferase complex subunit TusB [Alteromonas ponticola]|uniref:Sulfurtransferase complex subunit TusB n=1 Tax=Alteromonas aquimaris TaxID=2998417 RepID=A0ABT3P6D0_9ALTE|nr:sulfurtransferase complex subunit TusB [Alteromonas aquimaris]MCW8108090.1 sulfurtransferase complex subunit TusB [Alteromonas aquimaris]